MTHKDIKDKFDEIATIFCDGEIDIWFTNGKNCIRVRYTNGQEVIFSYNSKTDWTIETANNYWRRIQKG